MKENNGRKITLFHADFSADIVILAACQLLLLSAMAETPARKIGKGICSLTLAAGLPGY